MTEDRNPADMPHPPRRPEAERRHAARRDDDLTADALRQALDHGQGGDKVNFTDPAAAPLGTDDEAAGHPPTQEQIRMAAAAELGPLRPKAAPKAQRTAPERAGARGPGRVALWWLSAVVAAGVLLALLFGAG